MINSDGDGDGDDDGDGDGGNRRTRRSMSHTVLTSVEHGALDEKGQVERCRASPVLLYRLLLIPYVLRH